MKQLVLMFLAVVGGLGVGAEKCGDKTFYKPCECLEVEEEQDLVCYHFTGTIEDLRDLFSSTTWPSKTFNMFEMEKGSPKIASITNVFNGAAFSQGVFMNMSALESVSPNAFDDSKKSMYLLQIENCPMFNASKFDFNAFEQFKQAMNIQLNAIKPGTGLPVIKSKNIDQLSINNFDIGHPLPEGFMSEAKASSIDLRNLNISGLPKNSFTVSNTVLDLSQNAIQSDNIHDEAFKVTGQAPFRLHLSDNNITKINQAPFERVFSHMVPLDDNKYEFNVMGNPLECGCDMAWIFCNETYQKVLLDTPKEKNADYICADKRPIKNMTICDFAHCPLSETCNATLITTCGGVAIKSATSVVVAAILATSFLLKL